MGVEKKRVSVVVDIGAEADQLNKIIENSKKNLENLQPKLGAKAQQDFTRNLEKMQDKLGKITQSATSGFGSQTEKDKAIKNIGEISAAYRSFISQLKGKDIKPEDILPTTQEYKALLKKYEKANDEYMKKTQSHLRENNYKMTVARQKEYERVAKTGKNVVGEDYTIEQLGKEDRAELKRQYQSANTKAGIYAKKYGKSGKELENYLTAQINSQSALNKHDPAQYKKELEAGMTPIKTLKEQLKAVQQAREYSEKKSGVNSAVKDYQEEASEVVVLRQAVEQLAQALKNLANPTQQQAKKSLDDLAQSEQNVSHTTDQMKKKVGDASGQIASDLQRATKVSELKNYFAYMFSATAIIMEIRQVVTDAIRDFQELDKQFNEISIVTGKSMNELWAGFKNLNSIAQQYGVTTSNVVAVQKLYYQQGRSSAEVTQLTGETLKFAKISGLDYADATDKMTAAINAYNIAAKDASLVTDTYAALSAKAAVDAEEVAVAMSKTASLAAASGSGFKDTSAYLSKIIETTREAPETAGTALKTILARFTEVDKLTQDEADLLDEGFNFNNIEKALKTVGVQSKNSSGQLRNFSEILNDLGPIWENLSNNQQHYIATQAAGARQQSRFIALLDNWKRTQELMAVAESSAGTGAKQLALSMDGIETKTNQLKATWQDFYTEFLTSDMFKNLLFAANKLLTVLTDIAKIPLIGPELTIGLTIVMVKLIKQALKYGQQFAKNFMEGYDSVIKTSQKIRDVQDAKNQYDKGFREGKTYAQGYDDGKKSEYAGDKVEKELTSSLTNKTNLSKLGKLGQFFGNVTTGAKAGAKQGFKNLFLRGTGVSGKAAGLLATGGTVGAEGAIAGGSAVAGSVASVAAVAAPIAAAVGAIVVTTAVFRKIQDAVEKKVVEKFQSSLSSNDNLVKDTTELTSNYNTALKLQQKGLLRTAEEASKYQEVLTKLKETYPQLVSTMADGTLELKAQSKAYEGLVENKLESIRANNRVMQQYAGSARAISGGVALSTEGVQSQENVKTTAANLSAMDNDAIETLLGTKIKAKNLASMSSTGINRTSLNKALGRGLFTGYTIDGYNELLREIKDHQADTNSKAYKLISYLAQQQGITADKLAEKLIKETSPQKIAEEAAVTIADVYASKASTTVSDRIKNALGKAYGGENGSEKNENIIRDYYTKLSQADRDSFETYLDNIGTSIKGADFETLLQNAKLTDDVTATQNMLKLLGLPSNLSKQLVTLVRGAILDAKKERDNILNGKDGLKAQYKEATGKDLSKDYIDQYGITQLSNLISRISAVSAKYGQESGELFEQAYINFTKLIQGSGDLQENFASLDLTDVSSVSKFGAEIAMNFGSASDAYKGFVNTVNNSSNILDRNFRTYSQLTSSLKTDFENIRKSMDSLSAAAEGKLDISGMFDIMEASNGAVKPSDFKATANGYLLSANKIAEVRSRIIELKKIELLIELEQTKLSMSALETEVQKTIDESEYVDTIKNATLARYAELQIMNAQKRLQGELAAEYENMNNALIKLGLVEKANLYVQQKKNQELLAEIPKMLDQISFSSDKATKGIKKTTDALKKLIDMLKQIERYAAIDELADSLNQTLTSYEFQINFSTNIDTVTKATKGKIDTLNNLISTSLAKKQAATQNSALMRNNLLSQFGQYVSFDMQGNLIENGQTITAFAQRISNLYKSTTDEGQEFADQQKSVYDNLLDQIKAYRTEKKLIGDCESQAEQYAQQVDEVLKSLSENIKTLEDKIIDLLKERDQKVIDNLQKRYDTMKEFDQDYLDSVREAVEKERQIRDQSEDYRDIEKQEKRLQLMKMSGGSATEIQALEEQIAKSRRELADQEVDNLLDELEKENSVRAEDMDNELDYYQRTLDAKIEKMTQYNLEVRQIMSQSKQDIITFMASLDQNFITGTEAAQTLWRQEMESSIVQAKTAMEMQANPAVLMVKQSIEAVQQSTNNAGNALVAYANTVSNYSNGIVGNIEQIRQKYINTSDAIQLMITKQNEYNRLMNQPTSTGSSSPQSTNTGMNSGLDTGLDTSKSVVTKQPSNFQDTITKVRGGLFTQIRNYKEVSPGKWKEVGLMSAAIRSTYKGATVEDVGYQSDIKAHLYKITFSNGKSVQYLNQTDLNQILGNDNDYRIGKTGRLYQFKTGGLVDYTGPAWVDGTKTKPEAFLSASDTSNIANLTSVLSSFVKQPNYNEKSINQNNGDTYYQIDIKIDELGEDYSVDDLMDEMENRIVKASSKSSVIKIK